MFEFLDIDRIEGEEIDLILAKKIPANPSRDYFPCYLFNIVLHGSNTKTGSILLRIGHNDNTYYGGNIGYGLMRSTGDTIMILKHAYC